tara:strand:+ start:6114 stop:6686 length:573 start_codon:yes stop_codon:yes gene_type:complete
MNGMFSIFKWLTHLASLLLIFVSCEKDKYVRTYRLPKIDSKPIIEEVQPNVEFSVTWEMPESWIQVDGHSMRLASFNTPFSEGSGDVSVTTFGGSSGGITLNVNRWLGQIGLESMSDSGIDAISVKKSGSLGEFSYFKLLNDKDQTTAILASIFQLKERTVFVKLSSSATGVNEIENDFLKFCNSLSQAS